MRRQIFIFSLILLINSLQLRAFSFDNSPMQGLHQEIQSEMEQEEPKLLPPVEILWRSALVKSPTLQLALQKMATKTGQLQPDKKSLWTQSLLQGMIQLGGIGSAVMTGSAAPLIGSNVLTHITTPDRAPERLTQITSADLVLLAREVEKTQKDLIINYLNYRQTQAVKAKLQAQQNALQELLDHPPQGSVSSTDTINALLAKQKLRLEQARQEEEAYRNVLILMAGEEALAEADNYANNNNADQKQTVHHE